MPLPPRRCIHCGSLPSAYRAKTDDAVKQGWACRKCNATDSQWDLEHPERMGQPWPGQFRGQAWGRRPPAPRRTVEEMHQADPARFDLPVAVDLLVSAPGFDEKLPPRKGTRRRTVTAMSGQRGVRSRKPTPPPAEEPEQAEQEQAEGDNEYHSNSVAKAKRVRAIEEANCPWGAMRAKLRERCKDAEARADELFVGWRRVVHGRK